MNKELELKSHPGRHGNQDDHKYKRTYSLDVRLSPLELTALKRVGKIPTSTQLPPTFATSFLKVMREKLISTLKRSVKKSLPQPGYFLN